MFLVGGFIFIAVSAYLVKDLIMLWTVLEFAAIYDFREQGSGSNDSKCR